MIPSKLQLDPPVTTPTGPQGTGTGLPPKQLRKIILSILISGVLVFVGGAVMVGTFLWPEYERSQLLKSGVSASGTIMDIKPTGNLYNDQPQVKIKLHVQPASGEAFDAEATMIINPVYLPQFQPGKEVQVRYDANDHTKITVE